MEGTAVAENAEEDAEMMVMKWFDASCEGGILQLVGAVAVIISTKNYCVIIALFVYYWCYANNMYNCNRRLLFIAVTSITVILSASTYT